MSGAIVSTELCLEGRLASAYPASRHDVELRIEHLDALAESEVTNLLARESTKILARRPACRKVVFAATPGDTITIAAAEAAGFRYVVDVDVVEDGRVLQLCLMVKEPAFVTDVDMDLDRVPNT